MVTPERILVTGASGFVGRQLLPALRQAFPDALLAACTTEGPLPDADLTLPLDLLDAESVVACIAKSLPDTVIHLAAESSVASSFSDPERTWRTNVDGSLALAREILRTVPDALFVFASSAEAYGLTFQRGVPLDEEAPFAPANPYAASKAAADIALGEMGLRGLRVLRLRPFNHTGPGQSDVFVVPAFARQIARIEAGLQAPIIRVGALDRWRDFLDVRDVCAAYVAALVHGADIPPGAAINIASGVARKIGDILSAMIARSGLSVAIETDAAKLRPTDVMTVVGDPGRAARLLGWTPTIAWDETVDALLAYWRDRARLDRSAS